MVVVAPVAVAAAVIVKCCAELAPLALRLPGLTMLTLATENLSPLKNVSPDVVSTTIEVAPFVNVALTVSVVACVPAVWRYSELLRPQVAPSNIPTTPFLNCRETSSDGLNWVTTFALISAAIWEALTIMYRALFSGHALANKRAPAFRNGE